MADFPPIDGNDFPGGQMEHAGSSPGAYAELPKPSARIAEYRLEFQKLL